MSQEWLYRYDTVKPDPTKHYEIDSHGYLRFIAPVSRTGYLEYFDSKSKESYLEFVPDSTLITSLDSFKTVPITNPHPPVRVNPKNSRQYQRGLTGYTGFFDGKFLWLTGTATDQELIQKVQRGDENDISLGYDALVAIRKDSKKAPNRSQLKRKGNHLAFVSDGRNGREVSLRLDSADQDSQDSPVEIPYVEYVLEEILDAQIPDQLYDHFREGKKTFYVNNKDSKKETAKKMTAILLGGQVYNVEGDDAALLKDAVTKLVNDSQDLKTKADSADTLTTKITELEETVTTLKTEKATVDGEVLALQQKLDEKETELQQKTDSADTLGSQEIENRIKAWDEVKPFLSHNDAKFAPQYGLTVPEIHKQYLLKRLATNDSKLATVKEYDATTPEGIASINAAYGALYVPEDPKNDSKDDTPSHSDVVLNTIVSTTTETKADSKEDPRAKLRERLETPSRK